MKKQKSKTDKQVEAAQKILNSNGAPHVGVIDRDHVRTRVDGDLEIFSREDRLSGMQGSGYMFYGPVSGDHRMITHIANDMEMAFRLIEPAFEESKTMASGGGVGK